MRKSLILGVCWILLADLSGCGTVSPADSRPVADDPVCLSNGDMACVRVRVDADTPHAAYRGKTYYFCSEECRVSFEKNPRKYLPASGTEGGTGL